jgi:hypothetical protein
VNKEEIIEARDHELAARLAWEVRLAAGVSTDPRQSDVVSLVAAGTLVDVTDAARLAGQVAGTKAYGLRNERVLATAAVVALSDRCVNGIAGLLDAVYFGLIYGGLARGLPVRTPGLGEPVFVSVAFGVHRTFLRLGAGAVDLRFQLVPARGVRHCAVIMTVGETCPVWSPTEQDEAE